jgi:hypothetical protein
MVAEYVLDRSEWEEIIERDRACQLRCDRGKRDDRRHGQVL